MYTCIVNSLIKTRESFSIQLANNWSFHEIHAFCCVTHILLEIAVLVQVQCNINVIANALIKIENYIEIIYKL